MRLNRVNTTLLCIISILALVLGALCLVPSVAYAETPLDAGGDGTYNVHLKLNMTMGSDRFSDKGIVEKIGETYYLTVTVVSPSELADLEMQLGGKSGRQTIDEDGVRRYIFTISRANLTKRIPFTVRVVQMNKVVDFSIDVQLSKATKVSDSTASMGDRPAEFVPVINTTASSLEMEKGSKYVLPTATATLCGEPIEVEQSAYYLKDGEREYVQIREGKIDLEKAGEYHVLYKAKSDKYMTTYGNPTQDIVDVKILSKVGASVLATIVNMDELPKDIVVQANIVNEGDIYERAKAGMKEIADELEVFNVGLYTSLGEAVVLEQPLTMRLRIDDTYDRAQTEVYLMTADGTLTQCETRGYGRYVEVKTDKVGTFVVCVPGVAFVMPMWGYPLIVLAVIVVVAVAVIVPVIMHVKRKNLAKAIEGEDNTAESEHEAVAETAGNNASNENNDDVEKGTARDIEQATTSEGQPETESADKNIASK